MANDVITRYPYRPFNNPSDEIRLLHISYSPIDGSCTLNLSHAPLHSYPPFSFSALSYVWGDETNTTTILIDGFLVSVTENLSGALTRLQAQRLEGYIWIDAICINQSDTSEKNCQVALMGRIFSQAEIVWVWMGGKPDHGALKWIQELGCSFRAVRESAVSGGDEKSRLESHAIAFLDNTDYEEFDKIRSLFFRPWWRRVWVIQEITLARRANIICGHDNLLIVPWEHVKECFHLFDSLWEYEFSITRERSRLYSRATHLGLRLGHLIRISEEYKAGLERGKSGLLLHRVLKMVSISSFVEAGIQATDPRDKVYGLLGIVREEDRQRVPLDYSDSMSLQKLTLAIGKMLLTDYGPRMLLNCTPIEHGSAPSWAFDPFLNSGTAGIIERLDNIESSYHPSKGTVWRDWKSRCQFRSAPDGRPVASLAGFILPNRIHDLGSPFEYAKRSPEFQTACRNFLLELRSMVEGVGSDDDVENIWRVPIARPYRRSQTSAPPSAVEAMLLHGFDVLMGNKPAPPELDTGAQDDWTVAESIKYTAAWRAHRIRSFIDDAGRPGLGPKAMEVGDRIAIFAGGHAPFAVREEVIGGETFYRLLGSVYIYGLMDGEAMEGGVRFEDQSLI